MSDTVPEHSVGLSKQEPLPIREKIINLFEELEGTKDEQRQINIELDKEIQGKTDAESDASHLRRQVQLVEINLDNTTNRVNNLTTELIEVTKVSEAAQQYELIFSIKKNKDFYVPIFFSICTDLENKSIVVKDKEIDLDDELKKAKESTIEIDKRLQEVKYSFSKRINIDFF